MTVHILQADARAVPLPDSCLDAIVTDPPYALSFMGRDWDRWATPAAFQAWCTDWATEAMRVLKPGGHLAAFGGTTTYHRLVCGIEDAGFEIREHLVWLYGQGMPKSLDVGKAIDKRPGVGRHAEFAAHLTERRQARGLKRAQVSQMVTGNHTGACWNWEHHQFPEARWWPALRDLLGLDDQWAAIIAEADRTVTGTTTGTEFRYAPGQNVHHARAELDVTEPATAAAHQWNGWGTGLKPGHEPIVLARKPLAGTVAANVLAYGTGALNITGNRIAATSRPLRESTGHLPSSDVYGDHRGGSRAAGETDLGRWPTNVLLSPRPRM